MNTEKQHVQEKLHAMRERSLSLGKELEHQLSMARVAYHQLSQRAGALASERDAVRAELERAHNDIEVALEERDRIAGELDARLQAEQAMQVELQEKVKQLTEQQQEKQAQQARLEQEVKDLQASLRELPVLKTKLTESDQQVAALNQARTALENDLTIARESLASAQHEQQTLHEEKERLSKAFRVAESQWQEAKDMANAEMETRLEAEWEAQAALREKITQLTDQVQEKRVFQTRLEQEVVDLKQGLQRQQDLEAKLAQSHEQVAALEHTVQKSFDDIELFQRREKEHAAEREALDRELRVAREEGNTAANAREGLAVELANARGEFDSAQRGHLEEVNSLEQRLADVESDRDRLGQQLDELEGTLLEAASRQVEDLEHALQNVRDAVTDAEAVPETQFDLLLQAKNEELEGLKSQLQQLGEEHGAAIQFLQQAGQEAEQLRLEAESGAEIEVEQVLQSRQEELDALKRQLQQLGGERDAAVESLQRAGEEADTALQLQLEQGLQAKDQELTALREQLRQLGEERDTAVASLQRAGEEADSALQVKLEQGLQSKEQELTALREQLQQLRGERDTAIQSVQEASGEVTQLRMEVEKIQALMDGEVSSEETVSELHSELKQARHNTEAAERERKQAEQHARKLESSRKPRPSWPVTITSLLVGVLVGIGIAWFLQKHVLHDDDNWLSQLLGDAQSSAPVTESVQSAASASVPSVYDTNPPVVPGPYPVK